MQYEIFQHSKSIYSVKLNKERAGHLPEIKLELERCLPQLQEIAFSLDRLHLFFATPLALDRLVPYIDTVFSTPKKQLVQKSSWRLPICLETSEESDLSFYFKGNASAVSEYVQRFLSIQFLLEFYGFLPGFGYLSGLPTNMILPRKANPKRNVLLGTVAVGGPFVGVYPQESPGGWNSIGRCPIPWINFQTPPHVFIQPKDEVAFYAVDEDRFSILKIQAEQGQLNFDQFKL